MTWKGIVPVAIQPAPNLRDLYICFNCASHSCAILISTDWRGRLLVSEAGSRAVSSYELLEDNTLEVISASVSNGNAATCWLANTWFGSVFTAVTGGNTLSSYRVRPASGSLRLLEADAAQGDLPADLSVTRSGRYLYVINSDNGTVGAFRVSFNGHLEELGAVAGLPPVQARGIAVRYMIRWPILPSASR